jgi:hypothetical protein
MNKLKSPVVLLPPACEPKNELPLVVFALPAK